MFAIWKVGWVGWLVGWCVGSHGGHWNLLCFSIHRNVRHSPPHARSKHFEKWAEKPKPFYICTKSFQWKFFFWCSVSVTFPLLVNVKDVFSLFWFNPVSRNGRYDIFFPFCKNPYTVHSTQNTFIFIIHSILRPNRWIFNAPLSTVDISIMTIIIDSHFPFMDFDIGYR